MRPTQDLSEAFTFDSYFIPRIEKTKNRKTILILLMWGIFCHFRANLAALVLTTCRVPLVLYYYFHWPII